MKATETTVFALATAASLACVAFGVSLAADSGDAVSGTVAAFTFAAVGRQVIDIALHLARR